MLRLWWWKSETWNNWNLSPRLTMVLPPSSFFCTLATLLPPSAKQKFMWEPSCGNFKSLFQIRNLNELTSVLNVIRIRFLSNRSFRDILDNNMIPFDSIDIDSMSKKLRNHILTKVKIFLEQREVAILSPSKICKNLNSSTYWNSNFHKFCWVIRTQPISVLK